MRITICGIPEIGLHCEAGVTHVLSILDPGWPDPEAFTEFPPHRREALRFHDVIDASAGGTEPGDEHVERLLAFGDDVRVAGDAAHLLIHCHAGISRSTAAAALLLAQHEPARRPEEIFVEIGRLRPRAWPNLRLLELGEIMLGRRGEIVPAAGILYRRVLEDDPAFARFIRDSGRMREVALADQFALGALRRPDAALTVQR